MPMSAVSAVFTADVTGLKLGTDAAAAALKKLQSASASTEGTLKSIARAVNVTAFVQVGQVAANAARSFVSWAAASSQSIDVLSKLSSRLGLTYSQMASIEMAGNLAGVGVEQLAKAFTTADRVFDAARQGSAKAQEAFARLGLGLDQLGQMGTEERFQAIASAIAALPDPASRAAVAMQIFGKAGADMLPLFGSLAANMASAQRDTVAFGLALTNLQGQNVEGMNDAFTRAGYAIQGVVTQVVANLAPAVQSVVDTFSNFVAQAGGVSIGESIASALLDAAEIFAGLINGMLVAIPGAWDYAKGVVDYFAEAGNRFQGVWNIASGIVQSLNAVGSFISSMFNGVLGLLATSLANWLDLGVQFSLVSQQAADNARTYANSFSQAANDAYKSSVDQFSAAGESMYSGFDQAWNNARPGTELGEAAVGPFRQMIQDGRASAAEAAKAADDTQKQISTATNNSVQAVAASLKSVGAYSTEGMNAVVRAMNGSRTNSIEQQQLDVAEAQLAALKGIEDNIGMEAVSL